MQQLVGRKNLLHPIQGLSVATHKSQLDRRCIRNPSVPIGLQVPVLTRQEEFLPSNQHLLFVCEASHPCVWGIMLLCELHVLAGALS